MKKIAAVTVALLVGAGAWTQCMAQDEGAPPAAPASTRWSTDQLDQLLQPIALYPDPLIGLILPASTEPSQVVAADHYIAGGGDPNQVAAQGWDPSVQGLTHYPTVLKWMDDNIEWTTELGQAFGNQQTEVMDSIQRLRGQAQSLGNLQTTPQENVQTDDGNIDIDPVDPDEMYVPEYPDTIYADPGIYCTFGVGLPIGLWLGFDWDWHDHRLIHWDHDHPRPGDWWRLAPNARRKEIPSRGGNIWHVRPVSRPVIVAGGDRGYGNAGFRANVPALHTRLAAPRSEAPRVSGEERGPTIIGHGESRPFEQSAPSRGGESRSFERSAPSESVFGGRESAGEVRASSARGEESRGGGGGGGGGGGSHGGGSGRR